MKCYYHIDDDAVGMCARCGKALCSVCAEDVGGALLCPRCIALAEEEEKLRAEQEALETKAETRLVVKSVEKTMLWSWIITSVLGFITIALIWQADELAASALGKIGLSLLYIYLFWSWYWGVIFIRERWGRKAEKATGGEHGWILGLILLFAVAPMIGFCGGGIYEYLKYRKIIKKGE
jgi:hypothetical protein